MSKVVTNLQELYQTEVVPKLREKFKKDNLLSLPKIEKVLINVGIGKLMEGSKDYTEIVNNIAQITGQKPVVAKAKKSISNFKLREGMPVGVYVTLRGKKMYDFLDKLIHITLPRTRDFRGISKKRFDGQGNYTLALKEHTVFPEINPDDIVKAHGLQITIVTSAHTDQEGLELLTEMGFPFQKNNAK